jgi:hypothetical protein
MIPPSWIATRGDLSNEIAHRFVGADLGATTQGGGRSEMGWRVDFEPSETLVRRAFRPGTHKILLDCNTSWDY